jgi:Ser/Thr protein kinase RdoA (MazF antagonist)
MHPIFKSLNTPPPRIGEDQAAAFLARHYDLAGELTPLVSERDQNFLVRPPGGSPYILKFANVAEPVEVTDFQNQALLHLAGVGIDFPVPQVVPTTGGDYLLKVTGEHGMSHSARLLTWLEGVPLQHASGDASVAAQTGTCLAELGLALRDFEHPASDYPLLWDIRNAGHLRELLPYVSDTALQSSLEDRLAHFYDDVRPVLDTLRMQVVHNDLNPSNMLVAADDASRLSGVIDFGDMVFTQLINDVAVAAAYFCRLEEDPYIEVVDFLAAYTKTIPLTAAEIDILPDMIIARHLTTVMITHWRASLYPDNRDYILRNEARARNMLGKVAGLSIDETRARFRTVCRIAPSPETPS